jgi:hypothetical protein
LKPNARPHHSKVMQISSVILRHCESRRCLSGRSLPASAILSGQAGNPSLAECFEEIACLLQAGFVAEFTPPEAGLLGKLKRSHFPGGLHLRILADKYFELSSKKGDLYAYLQESTIFTCKRQGCRL